MMARTQSSTGKSRRLLARLFTSILLFSIAICFCNVEEAYAFNGYTNFTDESKYWWNGSTTNPVYKYLGEYDLSANHEVNLYYQDSKKVDEILKAVYQQCLAWGITKNGAAAIVGNFKAEGAEPTITESWVDWDQFVFGKTGIGIMGFTWYSVQGDLFNTAHEMGKPWTDLGVQLTVLKNGYLHPDGDHSDMMEFYEEGHSVEELTDIFCAEFERPAYNNFDDRESYARAYYDAFKDLPPKDYGGSLSTGGNTVNTTGLVTGDTIVNEWELVGMPTKSGLTADLNLPRLVSREDLSIPESYNLSQISESISLTHRFDAWQTARVVVIFVGLLMVIYAIMLALAMVFDNWNNFLDIGLVRILSLGGIKYSAGMENIEDGTKYISTKRLTILIIVMFIVACIFISGGIMPFVIQWIYRIYESFGGG